jgi:two-component system, LytTR family, response regulator
MKIRTCLADDEPLALERLRMLLQKEEDIQIVRQCATGKEVLAAIAVDAIEVIFLDITMPGLDGFEVLQALPKERTPLVVLVTASEKHAVRAFEVPALHYLLKPYKQSALSEAVARARTALLARPAITSPESGAFNRLQRIPVRLGNRILFVRTDQIDWIESAGNYAILHCGRDNHVVRQTMKGLEDSLPGNRFLRVSRSALVNRDRVREIQPDDAGDHMVILSDGKRIAMSRSAREVELSLKFV